MGLDRVNDRNFQACGVMVPLSKPVFSSKIQNSKKKFRHPHGDLNLDEIKNALRLLSVNDETNLMNQAVIRR